MRPTARVLLARPHDFLVERVSAMVRRLAAEPVPLAGSAPISPQLVREVSGAVISTAVTSVVSRGLGDTLRELLRLRPGLPLLIATLTDFKTAQALVLDELERARDEFTVFELTDPRPVPPGKRALPVLTWAALKAPDPTELDARVRALFQLGGAAP